MLSNCDDNLFRVGHADGVRRLPNAKTKLFFQLSGLFPILFGNARMVGEAQNRIVMHYILNKPGSLDKIYGVLWRKK